MTTPRPRFKRYVSVEYVLQLIMRTQGLGSFCYKETQFLFFNTFHNMPSHPKTTFCIVQENVLNARTNYLVFNLGQLDSKHFAKHSKDERSFSGFIHSFILRSIFNTFRDILDYVWKYNIANIKAFNVKTGVTKKLYQN